MADFSFDKTGFKVNGKDTYLVSGEFHYFRVPKEDWRRRMQLFLDAGGNCLATYVPWLIHEPEEGKILFDDVSYRDLTDYLKTAQEMGLMVLLRPGPYQYSELTNAGIPTWLLEKYPEILAVDIHGKPIRDYAVSYIHPTFLEKARKYYRAFADVVRPFMMENGGPVCLLQVDNELAGIHLWSFSMDYNPESMGFGKEDGRYPCFLKEKYGTIQNLNVAYGTAFQRFALVRPVAQINKANPCECRRLADYAAFYRSTMAEYLTTLAGWLREDGLGEVICHNSGTPTMNCLFPETVDAFQQDKFLLSSDHYYNLDQNWGQNNPTPQYAIRVLQSCDTLRALGMPPVAMELPGGSCSDTPPIQANDMLACYMTNAAMGLKGLNYYIFTGGPNVPGTGESCDLYDFGAPVAADGTVRQDKYDAISRFGHFLRESGWMQRAHRVASVQIGFEWNMLQSDDFDWANQNFGSASAGRLIEKGLLYTLLCSRFSGEMKLLTDELDTRRPLIVPCAASMSGKAQRAIVDFVGKGGKLLMLPVVPQMDLDYTENAQLKTLFESAEFAPGKKKGQITVEGIGHVFGLNPIQICTKMPENATAIVKDDAGQILGFEMPYGQGKIVWLGFTWMMTTFPQAKMLELVLDRLEAKPCVESGNRNIFTALWQDNSNRRMLYVMNLYSCSQITDIHVFHGEEWIQQNLELAPMEVKAIAL